MHVVIHSKTKKLSQFSYRLLQIHLTTNKAMHPVASVRSSIALKQVSCQVIRRDMQS